MIKSYLTIAIRNLGRNKVFSSINIVGLSVGLTCGVLILLWVNDEFMWDRFHSRIDQLYRVYINRPHDQGMHTQNVVPLALWEELKNVTGVRYVAPTNGGGNIALTYEDRRIEKRFYYSSDDFWKMFSFTFVEGSAENELQDASSIILTESTAKALFGDEGALGKVVRVEDYADLKVSGVVQDPPRNSTLQFQCFIPFRVMAALEPSFKEQLTNWGNSSFHMYIELEPGADPTELDTRIRNLLKEHRDQTDEELMLFPMISSRLYSEFEAGKSVGGAIVYVRIFAVTAILILALACINFMNLATARSEKRAKEVGIRKTVGSQRKQLIFQFLAETILTVAFAFLLAVGMVEVSLPFFNSLVEKNLRIEYDDPLFWVTAVTFILVTGIVSGAYPAFFLSSFRPVTVLKGLLGVGRQGALPRKVLVTTQFFFSISLLICTVVVFSQINHLRQQDAGYDKDNLLMVSTKGDIPTKFETIKNELLEKSLATSVSLASSPVTDIYLWNKPNWPGQRPDQVQFYGTTSVGYDYAKTVNVKILQGREFDRAYNDSASVLLNQTAVDLMEFANPIGQKVSLYGREFTVVGVLEDMIMDSPYHPAGPAAFIFEPSLASSMLIRLPAEGNISEVMKDIEKIFKTHNPEFPFSYTFADESFDRKFAAEALIGKLAKLFAILAIIISSLGLFGLSAFTAERRTKEIGIRKVMGATLSNIVALFSKDFSKLVLIAFLLSTPLTWWIMDQWLQQYAFRVDIEWWMITVVGIFTVLLTWSIVGFQAAKAAMVNPTESLRNE